jgi:DNA-binding NtrC family response regulator
VGAADHIESLADQASTILLVEDDALLRVATADHLRHKGYRVVEAGTVVEAAMVLSSGPHVSLVLTDVDLPGAMGGLSLVVWTHTYYPAIPVIVTSGVDAVVPTLSSQNAVPFLAKPFDFEVLTTLVAEMIAKSAVHG